MLYVTRIFHTRLSRSQRPDRRPIGENKHNLCAANAEPDHHSMVRVWGGIYGPRAEESRRPMLNGTHLYIELDGYRKIDIAWEQCLRVQLCVCVNTCGKDELLRVRDTFVPGER